MKIDRWKMVPGEPNCVVAEFSAVFADVTVDGLTLCRRRQPPRDGFVRVPKNGYSGERACRFSDAAYTEIMDAAFDKHFEVTGQKLCGGRKPVDIEGDDAGLRRVVRADVEEAMYKAGL